MYILDQFLQVVKLWVVLYQQIPWLCQIGNILWMGLFVKNSQLLIESVKIRFARILNITMLEWHHQSNQQYSDQPIKTNA
jgi:hypothetical protein